MPLQAAFFEQEIIEEHVIGAAGLRVLPFATSHDATASFSFRVESPDGDALGYITDSGMVPAAAHAALHGVRILALESNHDEAMLKNGDYPMPSNSASPRTAAICRTPKPPTSFRPSLANRAQ